MPQTKTVDALLEAFFQQRQPQQSLAVFVDRAEAMGEHQLAKIIRAVIASDGYRNALMRKGFPKHINSAEDFYVCPQCGLIYDTEAPDQCLVDETPGNQFEHIA